MYLAIYLQSPLPYPRPPTPSVPLVPVAFKATVNTGNNKVHTCPPRRVIHIMLIILSAPARPRSLTRWRISRAAGAKPVDKIPESGKTLFVRATRSVRTKRVNHTGPSHALSPRRHKGEVAIAT